MFDWSPIYRCMYMCFMKRDGENEWFLSYMYTYIFCFCFCSMLSTMTLTCINTTTQIASQLSRFRWPLSMRLIRIEHFPCEQTDRTYCDLLVQVKLLPRLKFIGFANIIVKIAITSKCQKRFQCDFSI